MTGSRSRSLSDHLADDIREQADALVEIWIDWIVRSASVRPARMLPREAIRDHIPSVIRGVAEALRVPAEAVTADVRSALRTHARLRHDQGFDIEELLTEYRGLDAIVRERMMTALEQYPGDLDPMEVGRLFCRLSDGLGTMTRITVAVYRETEVAHRRELHEQLEDYVRTITHELKQPINAITAGAGMLDEEAVASRPDQRRRYVDIIRRGIGRAMSLIEDIRTLALVEGAEQDEEWRSASSSVALVLEQFQEQARERDVRLEVARPLPQVDVDSTRLEIALVNLVSNAIKYSDSQKAERWVRIEMEQVASDGPQRWEVRVVDNGLGIPEAVQPQVFERHFRAHPRVGEGTGLGLAISRQVVEQAGGRMWFESEEGVGSTFHVVLPGHRDPEETDHPEGEEAED